MKKRMASTLPLLFAASAFLFSACSKNSGTDNTGANTPGAATPTSSPSATSRAPISSQATKSGWWVRINPSATTAKVITLQIGSSKLQREEWRVWNAGEPAEFDVPEKYMQSPRLYLRGAVTPIGNLATLCMMYKDRGVEHMSFDDDDSETKSQTEIDIKCRL
jgi:hypothetical protein